MIPPFHTIMAPESQNQQASSSLAAQVTRDVFYELISTYEEPPTLIEVKKKWPARYVYFIQHPVGVFFMSDSDRQDFSKAQVIPVEKVYFPITFYF